jgi:hypothetical protein
MEILLHRGSELHVIKHSFTPTGNTMIVRYVEKLSNMIPFKISTPPQVVNQGGSKSPAKCKTTAAYLANPDKFICNEKTGKWVTKTGDIGKSILKAQALKAAEVLKNTLPPPQVQKNVSPPKQSKCKVTATYLANPDKFVCNEKSGKWVLKSGDIGKSILKAQSQKNNTSPPKIIETKASPPKQTTPSKCKPTDKYLANPDKYVCNEINGKWVLKTSDVGKAILKMPKSGCKPTMKYHLLYPEMYVCNEETGKFLLKNSLEHKEYLQSKKN